MYENSLDSAGSEPAVSNSDPRDSRTSRQSVVVERLSRYGVQVMPSAFQRRSRLQRQQEICDFSGPGGLQPEAPERGSFTPAKRKKYLQELLLSNSSHSGFSSVLSSRTFSVSFQQDTDWALYPMEHAWMLSAIEGNYETILEFITVDPQLLTRRDFISGYSVLHWLAKGGQDETLLRLLRYAEGEGISLNVNLRGSGGLTPLHVASIQSQYMVIKLLVGAFGANVDVMDYNGKRPWQYLKGDAPLEMKELLGTWDDEHNCGSVQNSNKNVNNNCADAVELIACDEADSRKTEEEADSDQISGRSGWRFESIRKLLSSFSFLGSKT